MDTHSLQAKIRIAIVGCGHIGHKHIQAILGLADDLEIVGIYDANSATLEQTAAKYQVSPYGDYEQMLEEADADIIVLCTPSGLHANQTITAAHFGKHVITEKPMATRWRDGLAMVEACDEAGVRLFVVKQVRHNTILQRVKEAISEERFGRIYHVNTNVYWSRPQSYYDQSRWRGTWEFDGGALMNQASHYVDLMRWLFGPIQNVQAMMATLGRKIEVEDTCVLNILWRSGAIGSMNVTMLTYPNNFETSLTILGSKGTVKIGGLGANKVEHWEFEGTVSEEEQHMNSSEEIQNGYPYFYRNVIDVLRHNVQAETDGREGLKTLEILIAAYLSARDGKTVSLPLEY